MTKLARRNFLKVVGAAATTAAVAPKIFVGNAFAAPNSQRKLVFLFGSGGYCGLQMAISSASGAFIDRYREVRPTVWQQGPSVPVGSTSYLIHPRLAPFFNQMYSSGRAAILDGIGVQNGSLSHEVATDDWTKGIAIGSQRSSVQKKLTERLAELYFSTSSDILTNRVLNRTGDATYSGRAGLTLNNLSSFGYGFNDNFALGTAFSALSQESVKTIEQYAVQRSWSTAESSVQAVASALANTVISPAFPNTGLGRAFRDLFVSIVNFDFRVGWVQFGGNDRHADLDRPQNVNNPMDQSAIWLDVHNSIQAFYQNLERVGRAGEVATLAMTEFGRTVRENATRGVDHGEGTCSLCFGGWINGGIYGSPATVTDLNSSGNRVTTKLPLADVLADLLNGLKITGNTPVSPSLFPFDHRQTIGLARP